MKLPRSPVILSALGLVCALPFIPFYQRTTTYPHREYGVLFDQFSYPGPFFGVVVFTAAAGVLAFQSWLTARRLLQLGYHAPVRFDRVSILVPLLLLVPLTFHRLSVDSLVQENGQAHVAVVHGFGDPTYSVWMAISSILFVVLLQYRLVLKDAEHMDY
jgi:hypothetical protein